MRSKLAAVMLLLVASCGGSVTDKASRTLSISLSATNAARDEFVKWDRQHQLEIVDEATSKEMGKLRLATYRARRQHVVQGFVIAYSAIATAAATLPLVEAGKAPASDLIGLLVKAAEAVKSAVEAYHDIRQSFSANGEESDAKPPAPTPVTETAASPEVATP